MSWHEADPRRMGHAFSKERVPGSAVHAWRDVIPTRRADEHTHVHTYIRDPLCVPCVRGAGSQNASKTHPGWLAGGSIKALYSVNHVLENQSPPGGPRS